MLMCWGVSVKVENVVLMFDVGVLGVSALAENVGLMWVCCGGSVLVENGDLVFYVGLLWWECEG